jgi:hypothetical protein
MCEVVALHLALLVNGLAVFIGTQIDPQVERLAADARYLWKRVTPHKYFLWTATTSVEQSEMQD